MGKLLASTSDFRLRSLALLACAALSTLGCGGSSYPVAPVTGRVTIDGQPMPGGQIRFAPVPASGESKVGKSAFALVKEDGTFELGTFGTSDGAIVGNHWVTVYSYNPRLNDGEVPPDAKFSKYSDPNQKTVVANTDNEIDIEITADMIRKYGVPASK